jgi:hypothetical protein
VIPTKRWLLLVVSAVAFLVFTPASEADTVYTYTGSPFTTCTGAPYVPPCSNFALKGTLDLTLSLSQLAHLTNFTVPFSDLGSASSITDGLTSFSSSASNATYINFVLSTNAASQITNWTLIISNLPVVTNTFDSTKVGTGTSFAAIGSGGLATFERSNTYTSEEIVLNTSTGVGTVMGSGAGTTGFNPGGNYDPWSSPVTTPESSTLSLLAVALIALVTVKYRSDRRANAR